LRDAAVFCRRLQADAGDSLAEQLAPVGAAFGDIADSLAARFGEWGAVSRYAAGRPSAGAEAGAGTDDLEALLERASVLAGRVAGSESTDDRADTIAALVADAYGLLTVAPADVAARLVNSVLRPLADGLAGGVEGSAAAPGTNGGGGVGALDPALWALAETATSLRVSVGSDPRLAAPLAEASACLQQLALESAPADGPEGADARLARLRELQAGLSAGIQVATDGPYLVTNVGSVHNWLGESIPVAPQVALCRCGESQSKPFCDGSHAQAGFSGEKDPNRVPDRLDEYVGQQVTIFDNRGICQHSGVCSDRLATVFRAGQEPFVAPSGGRMDEIIRAVRSCPSGALGYAIDGVRAQADIDHHATHEPAIEVTKDGPYRITGAIELIDGQGADVPRSAGASREHYALCRCGHSQNKPFCSGMHWYIDFRDPAPAPDREPTIFEWAGGLPALRRMTGLFYEKLVPEDPLLGPLFANMSPDHPERVAAWLGEVFGGPPAYSEGYGGYPRMLSQHVGKGLTEERRARWVALISRAADEAMLPADPEFRSAFTAYVEWGSRLALENSQPGAKPPEHMPMPHWGWGAAGPPGARISALATDTDTGDTEATVVLPAAGETVSFEAHIKPLFRERDRKSMKFAFDLWSYDDVRGNAAGILERLQNGSMPCDGAWPADRIEVFERWSASGMAA